MVGLAILFIRFQGVSEISGQVILQLQNTDDIAALRCMGAEIAELARSETQDSWIGTCLNSITLTFRAGYLGRVMATTAVHSHPFEFHSL